MPLVKLQIDVVTALQVVSKIIAVIPTIWEGVTIFIKYNFAEFEVEKILPVLPYAVLEPNVIFIRMVVLVELSIRRTPPFWPSPQVLIQGPQHGCH